MKFFIDMYILMTMNTKKVSNIRYASIRELDISNGEGVGIALFVQGCPFNPHCYNCFNPDTWDFNGGKEWTPKVKEKFLELIDKPYITRVSILGGEPLADENIGTVLDLVNEFRLLFPEKIIWLYTGYTAQILKQCYIDDNLNNTHRYALAANPISNFKSNISNIIRSSIMSAVDILVDGQYVESQRDITLKWRGSKNQRVIDVKKSLKNGEIVLWTQ